jgi:hemoglobin
MKIARIRASQRVSRILLSVAFVLPVALAACAERKTEPLAPAAPTLYERLGGVYAIATVVDDFIERLLLNDTLNANPAIKAARDRVPKAGLKYQVTAFMCQATGGPCVYTGRSMKQSHAHLNIGEKEWQALAAEFKKSLDKFNVPQKEQDELFTLVGSVKSDIVVAAK